MYLKEALKFVNGTSATVNGLVTAVSGGVLSPFVYGFSALEKRRILATIDDRIKNNPEQAADLLRIKKSLEEGKPLQSALGFVANAVKDIGKKVFGLGEDQAQAAATSAIQAEVTSAEAIPTALMQTGDPEAFAYAPSVVNMERPKDVPITLGGGDPEIEAAFGQPVQEQTEAAFGDAG